MWKNNRISNVFIQLTLISIVQVQINCLAQSTSHRMDTIYVLGGRLSVVLKSNSFAVLKNEELRKTYAALFNPRDLIAADGFRIDEKSTLRFYQTNIENHEIKDGGVSTWQQITSFTDKIPQYYWLESGWERMSHGAQMMYFVKLISLKQPQQYFKFVFYYIDKKLAFSLFQCPVQLLETFPVDPGSFVAYHNRPLNFGGLEK